MKPYLRGNIVKHQYWQRPAVLFFGLFFLALMLRLVHASAPLWMDEIFGWRLADLGFRAIIENSYTDPHPPLYYLVQWVASGFGAIRSEFAWRWLPILCGTLTVPIIWLAARTTAGSFAATLAALVAATSPTLMFYSQEARPFAFLVLISAVSLIPVQRILSGTENGKDLAAWVGISLIGIYFGYSYLMIVSVQGLMTGIGLRFRRAWWLSVGSVTAGTLPLLPFAYRSLRSTAQAHEATTPLTFWQVMEILFAGEQWRYGITQAHRIMPVLVIALCVVGGIAFYRRTSSMFFAYMVMQVIFPPIFVFGLLTGALGIRLPYPEGKQFLVLLPVLFIFIAWGLGAFGRFNSLRGGAAAALVIFAGMLALNSIGILRYWTIGKGAESKAVLEVLRRMAPDERLVSLHHAPNIALAFYGGDQLVHCSPMKDGEVYAFVQVAGNEIFRKAKDREVTVGLDEIRGDGKFWVIYHATSYKTALEPLTAYCTVTEQMTFFPIEVLRISSCVP